MISIYIGRRGAGKTLTMVKDAYIEYMNGRQVLTNMEGMTFGTFISNEDILTIDKYSDIENCVLLIDELQIFFDSRRSMKKEALNFSNFVQQIRKRNIDILGTTQFSNAVEKRIRDHTDYLVKPKMIGEWGLCEVEYIDLTSVEGTEDLNYDRVQVVYDARPFFEKYDTGYMVK